MGSANPVILIVEDEPMVRELAVEEFEENGFAVIEAGDGRSALEQLQSSRRIDLLFTDIRLGGEIDGWAVAETARTLRPALPVIYATGFTPDHMRIVPGGLFFKKPYRAVAIVAAAADLGLRPAPPGT